MLDFFKSWNKNASELRQLQRELTALFAEQGVNFMHLHPEIHKFLLGTAREIGAEGAMRKLDAFAEQLRKDYPELTEADEAARLIKFCESVNKLAQSR